MGIPKKMIMNLQSGIESNCSNCIYLLAESILKGWNKIVQETHFYCFYTIICIIILIPLVIYIEAVQPIQKPKKNCNRGTAFERSVENFSEGGGCGWFESLLLQEGFRGIWTTAEKKNNSVVCLFVLRLYGQSTQGVMSGAVSLSNHTFTGQA